MTKLTYSVAEAVTLTGLHRVTIHRALTRGDIMSKRVGGRRLIDVRSLHAYVGVPELEAAPA